MKLLISVNLLEKKTTTDIKTLKEENMRWDLNIFSPRNARAFHRAVFIEHQFFIADVFSADDKSSKRFACFLFYVSRSLQLSTHFFLFPRQNCAIHRFFSLFNFSQKFRFSRGIVRWTIAPRIEPITLCGQIHSLFLSHYCTRRFPFHKNNSKLKAKFVFENEIFK